jgi:hypothetical protein
MENWKKFSNYDTFSEGEVLEFRLRKNGNPENEWIYSDTSVSIPMWNLSAENSAESGVEVSFNAAEYEIRLTNSMGGVYVSIDNELFDDDNYDIEYRNVGYDNVDNKNPHQTNEVYYNVYIEYEDQTVLFGYEKIFIELVTLQDINSYIIGLNSGKELFFLNGITIKLIKPTKLEIYNLDKIDESKRSEGRGKIKEYIDFITKKVGSPRQRFKSVGFDVTDELIEDFSFMDPNSDRLKSTQKLDNTTENIGENETIESNKSDRPESDELNSDIDLINIPSTRFEVKNLNIQPALKVEEIAFEFAEHLSNMKDESGQMIGVFGKWGRGKTYFIRKVCNKFGFDYDTGVRSNEVNEKYHFQKFNPWKYQDTPAIWAYLFEEMFDGVLKDKSWYTRQKNILSFNLMNKGWFGFCLSCLLILLSFAWIFLISLQLKIEILQQIIISLFSGGLALYIFKSFSLYKIAKPNAIDVLNKYLKKMSHKTLLGYQSEIQNDIKCLIKTWIREDQKLVLIIDDLDRCSETKIIEIVDSLRVMLEHPEIIKRLIVVLLIDDEKLKAAIRYKYRHVNQFKPKSADKEKELESLENEYLDKLFISSIKLPKLTKDQSVEFFVKLVEGKVKFEAEQNKESKMEELDSLDGSTNDKHPRESQIEGVSVEIIESHLDSERVDESTKPESEKVNFKNDEEITANELRYFKEILKKDKYTFSPRQIKIIYYRYLLARNLWNKLNEDKALNYEVLIEAVIAKSSLSEYYNLPETNDDLQEILDMVVAY